MDLVEDESDELGDDVPLLGSAYDQIGLGDLLLHHLAVYGQVPDFQAVRLHERDVDDLELFCPDRSVGVVVLPDLVQDCHHRHAALVLHVWLCTPPYEEVSIPRVVRVCVVRRRSRV